jgi:hypothetical protein
MGGFFSGVSPEAVGTVFFHPGVRPASIGEGAAGVVNLSSRPARQHESLPLRAEITLASLRAMSEARFWDGKGGVLVSARRSWWDWATESAADQANRPEDIVAFNILSWSGVFDYSWGDYNRVEVSALFEEDQLDGGIPGIIDGNVGRWGNQVERVSFDTRVSDLPVRFTVGTSRYRGQVWQDGSAGSRSNGDPDVVTLDTAFGEVLHTFVRGEVTGERVGARPARWTLGLQWTGQSTTSTGAAVPPDASGKYRRALQGGELEYGVVYGEYLLQPRSDVTIRAGLRWETGGAVQNGGQDRVAPRISSRFQLTPRVALSAGFGRSFQYTQTIGEVGNAFGPDLHFAQRWLLAGEDSPMIRSDIATVGLEGWIGGGWLASTTAYARRATGVAVPDPRTGSVFPPDWPGAEPRPAWVDGMNRAVGVEVSLRRLAGRVTGSASYSYGDSRMDAAGMEFAASADRRHVIDATVMVRARDNLLLGAAFTGASGAPFTRTFKKYCHDWPDDGGNCPPPATGPVTHRGPPNAERGPTYASLDLLMDWTHRREDWTWGVFVQLRNSLGRDNPSVYKETFCLSDSYVGGRCSSDALQVDDFEDGIFFPLPLFGFHLIF